MSIFELQFINVNAKHDNGWTAILYAVQYGYIDIVKAIVNLSEISSNIVAVDGTSILHVASTYGQLDIVKYLVSEHNLSVDAL